MPAVLCATLVEMALRSGCSTCPSSTGGRTYTYKFSAEMPGLSMAVAPPQLPHRVSYNLNQILMNLPKSAIDCACPSVTEVRMRCRFLHLPDQLDPPVVAKAHFIDQNQFGNPGGQTYPACLVGVVSVLAQSSTDMTQPLNTVFTAYHRERNTQTPDFTVTVYFTTWENAPLPLFPTTLRFVFDFEVCFEDTVQCAEPAPEPVSYEEEGVEGMVE